MDSEHRLIKERKEKLKALKEMGVEVYPYKYDQTHYAKDILEKHKGMKPETYTKEKVSIAGRIVSLRKMGKVAFFDLQDMSGKIQVHIREDAVKSKYKIFKKIDVGDCLGVKGIVFTTKTGQISVFANDFEFLAKSIRPFPEKYHGLKDIEERYRKRYVDFVVNPDARNVFVKRAMILKHIRKFLDDRGFMEVQTPILQPLYGGGMARPFVTKINAWDMTMYLRIAYEIYLKKLIVGGFEKIYDLSYCFRNEGSDKTHNPEFSMMEIQWAYADYNDNMKLTEELWEYVAKQVNGTTKIEFGGKVIDLKAPWPRLRMVDAIKKYANIDVEKLNDNEIKGLLKKHNIELKGKYSKGLAISLLFEELCEKQLIQPVHIIDHPVEICPLAKPCRYDKRYAERCESFINGWEVGNLYSELNDPVVQLKNFQEQQEQMRAGDEEAHPLDMDFIEALEYGLPPNSGNGVGVDRMVMLLTGQESIRDIILFPIMKPKDLKMPEKSKETRIAAVVINKGLNLKQWQEMNTVAHLNASFAARAGKSLLMQDEITTKDKKDIKLNIQHAIMIKSASSNKELRDLIKSAKAKSLEVYEFTREMIEATDDKKVIEWTKSKNFKDIDILGVLVFGKKPVVDELTKNFELYGSDNNLNNSPNKSNPDNNSNKKKNEKTKKENSFEAKPISKAVPSRENALALLESHVKDKYQLMHAKMVAHVMEKYAEKFNEDKDLWYITGLVHDLDFYEFPDDHPDKEVEWLKQKNYPDEIIHAIKAHYFKKTKVMPSTKMAKALVAVDELTGLLYAYSLMRPGKWEGMKAKGFKKKFKDKTFAAKISREDILFGIEKLGVEFNEHVQFVIDALSKMDFS